MPQPFLAGVTSGRCSLVVIPQAVIWFPASSRMIGKSSIQYVNEEDKDKPKTQQYRVFVDAPLTRPAD